MQNVAGIILLLSLVLLLWQVVAGFKFPLDCRSRPAEPGKPVSLLKPLKGVETETRDCLESFFQQEYPGGFELCFGVADLNDPVCAVVRDLMAQYPERQASLISCEQRLGANPKVSTLAQLFRQSAHELVLVSDADVKAPGDLLAELVPLMEGSTGLVCTFYRLTGAASVPARIEAAMVNADFWSQVLQRRALAPINFALGAVMLTSRRHLESIGGFEGLIDFLADDYQLGRKIHASGQKVLVSPLVVNCAQPATGWKSMWQHQLRWARTIRCCEPLAFALSIFNNVTFAAALLVLFSWSFWGVLAAGLSLILRIGAARKLSRRCAPLEPPPSWSIILLKDFIWVLLWVAAFWGNRIVWRGEVYCVTREGKLVKSAG